jgi:8-oxo-dGTP pyrophosphatase MutT (NUDIX family)
LQQKADDSWSLPAGAIEPGESPENAVKREVLEETGYDVSAQMLAGVCGGSEFRYTYANGHQVEYTVVLYYCTAQKIDSPLDPETRSIAYFSEGEMPHLAMPYPKELLFPSRMKP